MDNDPGRTAHRARSQRRPWLLAAVLLLASAVASAYAVHLHWLPCRGSMFEGTAFDGYSDDTSFSDACLRRMNAGGPFPYPAEPAERTPGASELGALGMTLAGLGWLVLALGLHWPVRTKIVAALPALAALVAAALCGAEAVAPTLDLPDAISVWLLLPTEVTAAAVLVFLARRHPDIGGLLLLRLGVVLWGTSAFGPLHVVGEYVVMSNLSSANWDAPPGTGYVTALVLVLSALAAGTAAVRAPRPSRPQPRKPTLVDV